jgi:hypothetical protein
MEVIVNEERCYSTPTLSSDRTVEDGFMRAGDPNDDVYRILVGNG